MVIKLLSNIAPTYWVLSGVKNSRPCSECGEQTNSRMKTYSPIIKPKYRTICPSCIEKFLTMNQKHGSTVVIL